MNWSLILKRNAAEYSNKECLIFGEQHITWGRLGKRVNALAQALTDVGVGAGDVVAILLYNCPEYIELSFAANQIGATWLPLNYRLAGPEFQFILNDSAAKVLVTEDEFAAVIGKIRPQLPALKEILCVGKDAPAGETSYEELLRSRISAHVEHAEVDLEDLHRLVYTSGTTGHPKGVMLTFGNLYWKNLGHIITFGLTLEDRTLVVGPMYHVGGMDLPGTGTLYVGGCLVILRSFDPAAVLEAIQREKVTNMWLAPAMINMLFQYPAFNDYDVSSMRFIIDGGEKMPLPLIEKFREKFPQAWFADAYGLTETVSGDTFLAKDRMVNKVGSVGKPVLQLRVRVVDELGRDVPAGELGEIVLRGPKVFKGYWKNPEATSEALRNGWFHTGDIGRLDEEGFLYLEDRKKDIIISGGENIASSEVERVIYQHPAVLETAVVAMPDAKWGEVPKAYVVLKAGVQASLEELRQLCLDNLAKFKVPKEFEFIDALPRNPSGKVLKRELRRRAVKE
ncbi:MAG: long-chain fatty acid--CoA ligase [Desulfomonilaceae bacterium]